MRKIFFIFLFVFISSYSYSQTVTKITTTSGVPVNPSTSNNQTNGNQKSQIVDDLGNVIDSHKGFINDNHLGVAVIQSSQSITANSSTANLASGATFTGTSVSTTGSGAIDVILKTDVNCIVYIEQSSDGTNWDVSDSYNYYYSINNFSQTVQSIGMYFRVRVTNISSTTSSYFRLQSILTPVAESLPRSTDLNGNLKVSIKSIDDVYGFEAENTPNGDSRAVSPVLLVGSAFDGTTVDPNFWTTTISSGATITQISDSVILSSNGSGTTGTTGSASIYSVRRARYTPGAPNLIRFQLKTGDTGTTGNTRRWCAAWGSTMPTITDGACFALIGDTFAVETINTGVTTTVLSGSFNGTLGSTYNLDTAFHTFEIYWNNRHAYFSLDDVLLHTSSASNTAWTGTVQLYIYMENVNNGTAANTTLTCLAASIRRLGVLFSRPTSKYQAGTTAGAIYKYGAGNLHQVVISGIVNNAVVTLYDNTAASGTIIWSSGAMSNQTVPFSIDFKGLPFFNGLTLVISGANCNTTTIYE